MIVLMLLILFEVALVGVVSFMTWDCIFSYHMDVESWVFGAFIMLMILVLISVSILGDIAIYREYIK